MERAEPYVARAARGAPVHHRRHRIFRRLAAREHRRRERTAGTRYPRHGAYAPARKFPRARAAPCRAALFDWLRGDVRDFEFPADRHSHVIHAGNSTSAALNTAQPAEMFDTMVSGTRRVLAFARERGAAEMLLVSSGAVYGVQPPGLGRIPENHEFVPAPAGAPNAYAEGKRAAESLCATEAQAGGVRPRIAALLCVCRPAPAARFPLRRRQLPARCMRRPPDKRIGGRHAVPLLSSRGRPRRMAGDYSRQRHAAVRDTMSARIRRFPWRISPVVIFTLPKPPVK